MCAKRFQTRAIPSLRLQTTTACEEVRVIARVPPAPRNNDLEAESAPVCSRRRLRLLAHV